jgi:eukaryotic-like serine/threonine-protein kinase
MSETSPETGSGSDKYRTLFELGQGGTANVSLAVARGPEGFKKLFVVKQLRSVYAQDPEFRAMFMTEARLSARLNHPHVVQVYEVFEQGVTPTILMEYIEGQTLDAVLTLATPKLPLELHLRVLADVLSGLHYSHELNDLKHAPLNVVHRDVSPHNVMVSYEGVVKVLDFGIAKLSGSTVETEAGVIKGKLRYMPPEQIAGEDVDRRADLFAVGVMLWEALSGTKLWKGLSDATIMNRVLAGEIPRPENAASPIPPELLQICLRALAPERTDRYQTALEFELALEDYLAKRSHYVSARELGKFMTDSFASVREAVVQRIERELGHGESSRPPPGSLPPGNATPSRTGYTASRSAHAEPPRSKLWMLAVAFVALGIALLAWGVRSKPDRAAPPSATSVAAPTGSHHVTVSIEARPETASISLDGVPVGNPYVAERAWDGESHRVRVSAPGFSPEESDVRFDADVRMFRALSPAPAAGVSVTPSALPSAHPKAAPRAPAAPGTAGSSPVSATSVSPSPVSASPGAGSCDPPYFYAGGIKRFKPECL